MRNDAKKEIYEAASWSDKKGNIHPCLFSDIRLDRTTIPKGWFLYEIRDDGCSGDWCEIAKNVMVNFWGSILSKEEIDFEGLGGYADVKDYSYNDDAAESLLEEWKAFIKSIV